MSTLTHGSLFSGIGGFDLAAELAGFENLFHCEYNTFGKQVLEYHFPNSDSYGDITTTDFTKYRGQITVLTGGFPCQPFSVAGKRQGADDNRYLWPEMLRAIREIKPTWVIGENVVGIASMVQPSQEVEVASQTSLFGESDHKRVRAEQEYVIETICADLEREGYSVQPLIIPACAIGAPHRRDRVWFLARLIENSNGIRCDDRNEEQPEIGQFGKPIARDNDGVCREERVSNSDSADAGFENLQQERENRVCESESTPNSTSERQSGRCAQNKEWKERINVQCYSERFSWSKTIANTKCNRSDEIYHEMESEQSNGHGFDSHGKQRTASDTESSRESWKCKSKQRESQPNRRSSCEIQPTWANFPTQPPIYTRDDGFSYNMAGCTISESKWREESVKACGNAIVPQVAFEIFKAIKGLENETK